MTAALQTIRTLRETLYQIGTAVNAAREYNRAGAARADQDKRFNPASAAIPL
ncbi:hypothetical protein [Rhizobium sp. LC145]|jgi:hypothetical protein|uniref:hypothetical protein n=1 Tax=Rhizobium sp. LC145 TaxID=1120688 RepID=UPI000A614897|nr:hypothetical protein [Rhizobium sp. LC145]